MTLDDDRRHHLHCVRVEKLRDGELLLCDGADLKGWSCLLYFYSQLHYRCSCSALTE